MDIQNDFSYRKKKSGDRNKMRDYLEAEIGEEIVSVVEVGI